MTALPLPLPAAPTALIGRILRYALAIYAAANIIFIAFVWVNHLGFPLHLDLMEGTVLQHVQQLQDGQPVYPEPTPAYVPLAYNVLYYVVSLPFTWIFGLNLMTLRLVAILGMFGSGVLIYRMVYEKTASQWWGFLAVGVFAAAYSVMDTYLDNAHSDSWFLFTALLGTYWIDRARSTGGSLAGLIVLVASFWFKQHGALFVIGGVLFLTWRDGLRRAPLYWMVAALLGPGLYVVAGPALFGAYYHYFTWQVPRGWSSFDLGTFRRYLGFIVKTYPLLALSGGLLTVWTVLRDRKNVNVWHIQFVFALLTGLMGTFDIGSADNVYIPMGVWFILMGMVSLHEFTRRFPLAQRYNLALLALVASFVLFVYNPGDVIVSARAGESYNDLIATLNDLDGTVYAPTLGQLPGVYTFYPAAHWVALEDMIRGPGRNTSDHPNTRTLLEPALNPAGPAYILSHYRLEEDALLGFLMEKYVLDTDYGDRFAALRVLPKRFDHRWPRYLYRYAPEEARRQPEVLLASR